jgi:hypothetical protein
MNRDRRMQRAKYRRVAGMAQSSRRLLKRNARPGGKSLGFDGPFRPLLAKRYAWCTWGGCARPECIAVIGSPLTHH